MKTLLVTGGAGFIGSCFVLQRIAAGDKVINLDKLTYSGNLMNLKDVESNPNYVFIHGDIGDEKLLRKILPEYQPDAVVNFAAESHVDRMSFVRERTASLIRNRSRTLLTVWGMTFATRSTARRLSGNLAGRRSISLKMGSARPLSGISITVNGLSPFRPANTRTGLRPITAAETSCPEGADCGKQQE